MAKRVGSRSIVVTGLGCFLALVYWILQNFRPVPPAWTAPSKHEVSQKLEEKAPSRQRQAREHREEPQAVTEAHIFVGELTRQGQGTVSLQVGKQSKRDFIFQKRETEQESKIEAPAFFRELSQWLEKLQGDSPVQTLRLYLHLAPKAYLPFLKGLENWLQERGFRFERAESQNRAVKMKIYLWERRKRGQ